MDTNGKVVKFVPCAYPKCADKTLRRVRDYCREHFVLVYLDGINKEEKNLLSALDILQSNKKKLMAELSACDVQEHEGLRLICHKCGGFSTKGYDALMQHQIYCTGKKKAASKPRTTKATVETDDEEMTDEE